MHKSSHSLVAFQWFYACFKILLLSQIPKHAYRVSKLAAAKPFSFCTLITTATLEKPGLLQIFRSPALWAVLAKDAALQQDQSPSWSLGPILMGQQKEMQFLPSRVHSPEILKILNDWKTIPLSKLLAAALGTVASILHSLPSTSKTQSLSSGKEWRHTMQQAVQRFSQGQELAAVGHWPTTYRLPHKSLPSLSNRWSLEHRPSRVDSFPAEIKDRRLGWEML